MSSYYQREIICGVCEQPECCLIMPFRADEDPRFDVTTIKMVAGQGYEIISKDNVGRGAAIGYHCKKVD